MKEIFGYMLGPKAENLELFKKLISDALNDHVYWRRNFYPEDLPAISAFDQSSEEYQRFVDRLRDGLFEFLSEAKKGVPFFSARYIGHMNTDLLLPALIGYFAAMLYNQNNVAGESSPVTAKLEAEVTDMMARMVGYRGGRSFGYLSSGGTTANFYGLWTARNVRTLPVSLRMAVDQEITDAMANAFGQALVATPHKRLAASAKQTLASAAGALKKLVLMTAVQEKKDTLLALDAWRLLNIPIAEATQIRNLGADLVTQETGLPPDVARIVFDQLVGSCSIRTLGDHEFREHAARSFTNKGAELFSRPWRVLAPKNGHYSWLKAMDLLGLGQAALLKIDHGPAYDMDLGKLETALRETARKGEWALALASIFGTTEEGSVDDLPGVRDLLTRLQQELGISVWWHVDAAYGGYLPTLMRARLDDEKYVDVGSVDEEGTLKRWLLDSSLAVGSNRETAVSLIEASESGGGTWLSWEDLMRRTSGLASADSITLDPHKLGYIPYPAGAVLLREGDGRHQVGSDAPYLWADTTNPDGFVGRFTLEGSRPGAAAVACWLAHRMVPLDQSGHGRVIALSMLGTRALYGALHDRFRGRTCGSRLSVVHQPHTNMLCYVPYHTETTSASLVKRLTKDVQKGLMPTNDVRPFMAVETTVRLATDSPAMREFDDAESLSTILRAQAADLNLPVIRSVVMGPYSVSARIRQSTRGESRPVFECFAEYLDEQIESSNSRLQADLFREAAQKWSRPLNAMVMDDDETVSEQLKNLIPELRHPSISGTWQSYTAQNAALQNISDRSRPLDLTFLDIDMRGASADPRGSADGGYQAFRAVLERNRAAGPGVTVKLVVFFTMSESAIHKERVDDIKAAYPETDVQTETLDKKLFRPDADPLNALDDGLELRQRDLVKTARGLVRRITSLSLPASETL